MLFAIGYDGRRPQHHLDILRQGSRGAAKVVGFRLDCQFGRTFLQEGGRLLSGIENVNHFLLRVWNFVFVNGLALTVLF